VFDRSSLLTHIECTRVRLQMVEPEKSLTQIPWLPPIAGKQPKVYGLL